jgi:broad specificity phosphatase PhoE
VWDVGARADRLISEARAVEGNVLLFAHGHLLRVLAARWLGLPPTEGRLFALSTASISVLGYDGDGDQPVLRLWNDTTHLR